MKEHREKTKSSRKDKRKSQIPEGRTTLPTHIREKTTYVSRESPYMEDLVALGEARAVQEYLQENIRSLTEPYEMMFDSFLTGRLQEDNARRQAIEDMSEAPEMKGPLHERLLFWKKRDADGSIPMGKIQDNSPDGRFSIDFERIYTSWGEKGIPITYQDNQVKIVFDEQGKITQLALTVTISDGGISAPHKRISLPEEETPELVAFAHEHFEMPSVEVSDYTGMISFCLDNPEGPVVNVYKEDSHLATGSYDLEKEAFIVEKLSSDIPLSKRKQKIRTDDFFDLLKGVLSVIPDHY